MTKITCTSVLVASLAWISAHAAPMEFDFKDPKGVNNIIFELDAPLEAINGTATGISGKITYDPANPGAIDGKLVLATESLRVPNPRMHEHLHGDMWMGVQKHPEIVFEIDEAKNVKKNGDTASMDLVGKITIKGITKPLTTPATLTYLKDKLQVRGGGKDGDLLVLRSEFSVKRTDFNINPGQNEEKVANDIGLTVRIAGASPK